ncbi:MAG: hypothetical protein V4546_06750 [Bacteroidota bacterium]
MAKKISDYDISYAEVMLLALSNKIDIRLNNADFNYLLDKNYFLDYLVYPNEETMSGLVSMLKEITQDKDKIFAFTLPRYSTEIRVLDKDEQVNEILSDLNIDIAIELIQSSKDLLNNITDVPDADFPYMFENAEVLGNFLNSEDDDLHLILISTFFFQLDLTGCLYLIMNLRRYILCVRKI